MKKGIILIIMLCNIIICNRVKALSLDGTPQAAHHTLFSSEQGANLSVWRNGANNLTTTIDFYEFTNNFDYTKYMVIPIRGFAQRIEQSNQNWDWLTDVELTDVIISFEIIEKNVGYVHQCELQGNLIVCPLLAHKTYNQFKIKAWLPDSQSSTFMSINEIQLQIGPTCDIYTSNDTNIIINQNENTERILEANTTYNNTGEDITNQTQDFEDYEEEERNILNSLDFSGIENITIGGSTNARTFVWDIVDRIRGMSNYIVMVMTSILGMGLIKMVLNR